MTSFHPPNVRFGLPGFAPGVRDAIYQHVYTDPANEVGGILAGDRRDDGVMVVGAIPAEGADGDVTSLTFTHDAWASMLGQLEARFPGASIVGWYHSHPGHGIFLSRHDAFIHQNFFPAAWQFAIVVDPHHHDEGLFMWRETELPLVAEAKVDPKWTQAAGAPPHPSPAARPPVQPAPPERHVAPPVEPEASGEERPAKRIQPREPRGHERSAEQRQREAELRAREREARSSGTRPPPASGDREGFELPNALAPWIARAGALILVAVGLVALLW